MSNIANNTVGNTTSNQVLSLKNMTCEKLINFLPVECLESLSKLYSDHGYVYTLDDRIFNTQEAAEKFRKEWISGYYKNVFIKTYALSGIPKKGIFVFLRGMEIFRTKKEMRKEWFRCNTESWDVYKILEKGSCKKFKWLLNENGQYECSSKQK